ncbi:MAG TPA: hypothetical protein VK171_06725 [Fimbriimonas sp.]|nr:hypothetical protein [Fimbriimonas sp.]
MTSLFVAIASQDQSQPPTLVAHLEAKGPIAWRIEQPKQKWVADALSKLNLSTHKVEAICTISENSLSAWRPDGTPHSDFEGFLRTKLASTKQTKFPIRFGHKNRVLVLNVPAGLPPLGEGTSASVNFDTGDFVNLYELSNSVNPDGYQHRYVPIAVAPESKFVSVPVQIHFSAHTSPVPAKVGSEFSVAENRYKILETRQFKDKDINIPGRTFPQSRYFSTIIVKKVSGTEDPFINGSIDYPPISENNPNVNWALDERGNFVERKPNEMFPRSRNIYYGATLQQVSSDPTNGTVTLVSNVNLKSLKAFRIYSSGTATAWLDNIPLDPKN